MTHLKKYFHNRKKLMGYDCQQEILGDKDHTSPQSPLRKGLEPPECGYSGDLLASADTLSQQNQSQQEFVDRDTPPFYPSVDTNEFYQQILSINLISNLNKNKSKTGLERFLSRYPDYKI